MTKHRGGIARPRRPFSRRPGWLVAGFVATMMVCPPEAPEPVRLTRYRWEAVRRVAPEEIDRAQDEVLSARDRLAELGHDDVAVQLLDTDDPVLVVEGVTRARTTDQVTRDVGSLLTAARLTDASSYGVSVRPRRDSDEIPRRYRCRAVRRFSQADSATAVRVADELLDALRATGREDVTVRSMVQDGVAMVIIDSDILATSTRSAQRIATRHLRALSGDAADRYIITVHPPRRDTGGR